MTDRICDVPECSKPHIAKGLCENHYRRHLKANGPTVLPRTLEERFESNIKKTDGCWIWVGTLDAYGYGMTSQGRRRLKAHRVAFEFAYGPIPQGFVIRHKCDNPPCVNPEHLEAGTRKDNNDDREKRGRGHWSNQTHCASGHPWSGDNLYLDRWGFRKCRACTRRYGQITRARKRQGLPPQRPRVPEPVRAEVLALAATRSMSQGEISRRLGVKRSTVSYIVNGRRQRVSAV